MYGAWSCGTDFNLLNLLWFSLLFSYSGLLSAQCTLVWAQKMPNVFKKWFWWWISFLIYMGRQQRITVQHVCPQHVAPVHVMFKSDQLLKNTDRQIYPVHEWHATSISTAHVYNVYQWQNKCCVSFEMAEVISFYYYYFCSFVFTGLKLIGYIGPAVLIAHYIIYIEQNNFKEIYTYLQSIQIIVM
jgi:hypothetical protein